MKLEANNDTERRLLAYLEKNASDALKEKIAALPEGKAYNLGAAFRHIQDEARKLLHSKSGFVDDETVFGWLIHYYEDVAPAAAKAAGEAEAAKAAEAPGKKRTHKTKRASSTPPSGGRSSCVARAAAVVSSPDSGALSSAAEQAAAAETTATAPESGFSLVLFEADEKGGAA
jgi:hypothetical protein